MTVRPPTANEQIEFLASIQTLLNEGQFTATYKFALLIALADLAIELGDESGRELEMPIGKIAEKFIDYYWRQAAPWSPVGRAEAARILAQNTAKQAEVLTRLRDVRERVSVYQTDLRRAPKAWAALVSRVKNTVKTMPLWKLQTLPGRKLDFLYANTGRGDSIVLRKGVAFNLRRFHPLVTGLARSAWLEFVRRLPENQPLLGQAQDLSTFLFGAERANLNDYRKALRDIQNGACFYCNKRLGGAGDVDHFIPWSRYPVDLAHNFVLADSRCNGRKRDFLADVPFLARWVERNTTRGAEMEERFDHLHLPFDRHISQQVTEWSYSQVERTGGQVWSGGADYAKLTAGWRSVLAAV